MMKDVNTIKFIVQRTIIHSNDILKCNITVVDDIDVDEMNNDLIMMTTRIDKDDYSLMYLE